MTSAASFPAAGSSPPAHRPGFTEAGDARMMALVRSLLAASGLLIIWLDPTEPTRLPQLTYASLGLYFLYSIALVVLTRRHPELSSHRGFHWADVVFATYLVALTEGTNSVFFFFYFFSILSASFTRGYRHGLTITLASLTGFVIGSMLSLPHTAVVDFDRMAIRPVYLLLFGYMMAHWGGFELSLKSRLALLHTLQSSSNPRLGKDGLILNSLAGLRDFFEADACVLVVSRPGASLPLTYHVGRGEDAPSGSVRELSQASASHFEGLPGPCIYPMREQGRAGKTAGLASSPVDAGASDNGDPAQRLEALAHLLEASALVTAPYQESHGGRGQVFVLSQRRRRRPWRHEDAEFLGQWAGVLSGLVDNATLTEELISHAAAYARRDVSRDLHDMTIQPYVGLKFALESLLRACPPDLPLRQRIEETVTMAQASIENLRTHTAEIRFGKIVSAKALCDALTEQVRRLHELFGLKTHIDCRALDSLGGKECTLIHRIVTEGLNNVLRHTAARQAWVVLSQDEGTVSVEIRNECSALQTSSFTPLSIIDRVTETGGTVDVRRGDDFVAVVAKIPLEVCHAFA